MRSRFLLTNFLVRRIGSVGTPPSTATRSRSGGVRRRCGRCGRPAIAASAHRLRSATTIASPTAARCARRGRRRRRRTRRRSCRARRNWRCWNTSRCSRRLVISGSCHDVIVSSPTGRILFRNALRLARRWWGGICVYKAVLAWIVHDGRIVAEGNDARSAAAFQNRARCADRRGCSRKTACHGLTRRGLHGLPFLSPCCG